MRFVIILTLLILPSVCFALPVCEDTELYASEIPREGKEFLLVYRGQEAVVTLAVPPGLSVIDGARKVNASGGFASWVVKARENVTVGVLVDGSCIYSKGFSVEKAARLSASRDGLNVTLTNKGSFDATNVSLSFDSVGVTVGDVEIPRQLASNTTLTFMVPINGSSGRVLAMVSYFDGVAYDSLVMVISVSESEFVKEHIEKSILTESEAVLDISSSAEKSVSEMSFDIPQTEPVVLEPKEEPVFAEGVSEKTVPQETAPAPLVPVEEIKTQDNSIPMHNPIKEKEGGIEPVLLAFTACIPALHLGRRLR